MDNNSNLSFSERSLKFDGRSIIESSQRRPHVHKIKIHNSGNTEKLAPAAEKKYFKSFKDVESISHTLSKHFIFAGLNYESRAKLISTMKLLVYAPNQLIFQQHQVGVHFFIIARGEVQIIINDKVVKTLGSGESFGELALLHDFPRSGTALSLTKVYLWTLHRHDFKSALLHISAQNYSENKEFLDKSQLFSRLTPDQKDLILGSIREFRYLPGQCVFNEGDIGGICYFIKKGVVVCSRNNAVVGEIRQGEYFGEQALIGNSVRGATITASTEVKCFGLSREELERALGNSLEVVISENSKRIAIDKCQVLRELDSSQKLQLIEGSYVRNYEKGDRVLQSGTMLNENIYLVIKGELKSDSGRTVSTFEEIGSNEVNNQTKIALNENIYASSPTEVALIPYELFSRVLGLCGSKLSSDEIKALKAVSILKLLSKEKLGQILKSFNRQTFDANDVIIEQNQPGDTFYMIESGNVNIIQDGVTLRTITKYDYFGERSLIFDECRTASVIASDKVLCWTLSKSDFSSCLNESLQQRLMKRINLQDTTLSLSDLQCIKLLGQGAFGTVFLVVDKLKSRKYALKVILKDTIEQYNIRKYVDLEAEIANKLDHEFIVKHVKFFEDSQRVYFLTEYINGSDLFNVIRLSGLLLEEDSKFYTACLILILEYLHEREIVYRDLKPENIIIDDEGYPKLIDFGYSKYLKDKTYTIVGTPHYMAPEIIMGKGYSFPADYWSLGIIAYECVYGSVPFANEERNPLKIYEAILSTKLRFPSVIQVDPNFKRFTEQLLSPNPAQRSARLKSHAWICDTDWDLLNSKDQTSPMIPDLPNGPSELDFNRLLDIEAAIQSSMSRHF